MYRKCRLLRQKDKNFILRHSHLFNQWRHLRFLSILETSFSVHWTHREKFLNQMEIARKYTKYHIYTIWYNFDIVLYRFLETGTSDRRLICIVQNLRFSGFSLYSLSFFLYSPFKFIRNAKECELCAKLCLQINAIVSSLS